MQFLIDKHKFIELFVCFLFEMYNFSVFLKSEIINMDYYSDLWYSCSIYKGR